MAASSDRRSKLQPGHAEGRLANVAVATAIANGQAHEELRWLAEEQAALRRVATLVARGAQPTEVFDAVTGEVGRLVGADEAVLRRYETDGTATTVSSWSATGASLGVGTRFPADRGTVSWLIFHTGQPARIDSFAGLPGACAAAARELGWRAAVGAPVIVAGRPWGMAVVVSKRAPRALTPVSAARTVILTTCC